MKIVLTTSNTGSCERIENEAAWPPLGLLYIATVLNNAGHECVVFDNAKEKLPPEKLAQKISHEEPDLVGVSALTPTFKQSAKLLKPLKQALPDVKIAYGNYHPTFVYDRLLKKYGEVDFVVLGEGEHTVLELVRALEGKKPLKQVRGIAFRNNGRVVTTPPQPLITDLDSLPFPDRSLLEHEYNSELVGLIGGSGKFTTVLTSRGCPYNCRYCGCSAFAQRVLRLRSAEKIVREMLFLQSEGYEEIGFVDDNLLANKKRVEELCALMRKEKLDFSLWCESRTDNAWPEALAALAQAGCKTIYFGMESGVQKTLDYYDKRITPDTNRQGVRNAKRAGIENVIGSFIVGAPVETREDIQATFNFALGLKGMDFPQMNVLALAPGTDLWREAVARGFLDEEKHWEGGAAAANIFPSQFTEADLNAMISRFYKQYVKRPSYLFHQLGKTLTSRHRLRIIKANLRAGTSFRQFASHLWGSRN